MKKKVLSERTKTNDDELLPEYNFSGKKIVRGKHYEALKDGYIRRIYESDGTVTEQFIKPNAPNIVLEPDVRAYFPTSEAVNQALRALITVIEQTPHKAKSRTTSR
jgi:hypothetical protein